MNERPDGSAGEAQELKQRSSPIPFIKEEPMEAEDVKPDLSQTNSTIFPIQLLDKSPRSDSDDRFIPVQVPELDFEELTFHLDVTKLSQVFQPQVKVKVEEDDQGFSIVEPSYSSEKAMGKRKANASAGPSQLKKIKQEDGNEEENFLARTSLLFALRPKSLDPLTPIFGKSSNAIKLECVPLHRIHEESLIQ